MLLCRWRLLLICRRDFVKLPAQEEHFGTASSLPHIGGFQLKGTKEAMLSQPMLVRIFVREHGRLMYHHQGASLRRFWHLVAYLQKKSLLGPLVLLVSKWETAEPPRRRPVPLCHDRYALLCYGYGLGLRCALLRHDLGKNPSSECVVLPSHTSLFWPGSDIHVTQFCLNPKDEGVERAGPIIFQLNMDPANTPGSMRRRLH